MNTNKSKLNSSQTQKRIVRLRPKVYEILNNIANRLRLKDTDGSYTKRYLHKIPFILQTLYKCKVVFVKSYRQPKEHISFPKLEKTDNKVLIIHVTEGALEIITGKSSEILYSPLTYFIDIGNENIVARIRIVPTNITLIIQSNPNNIKSTVRKHIPLNPIKDLHISELDFLANKLKPIPRAKNKSPISYIRANLSQEEIRERIIFLDAEFVKTETKNSPGSITIIDYHGKILFDEIVKPTEEVIRYLPKLTGFNKRIIDKGMREEEALEKVHKIVHGKILIGSDLSQDIMVLRIDKNNLLGIRDLSTAKTIREKLQVEVQRIGLATMVHYFFDTTLHHGVHTSYEDAMFIREIYLQVEEEYQDDFYDTDNSITSTESESSRDTEKFGTPLLDTIDLSQDEEFTDKMDYQLEPVSDEEIEDENKEMPENTVSNTDIDDTEYITVKIPRTINTADGKILSPEYILYSDAENTDNKNFIQTIFKHVPNKW